MKIWAAALSIPIAVFFQATLLYQALPGGVTPDLALLLTLMVGLVLGGAGGAAGGLWAGALIGAARGAMALPMALAYGLVGWLAGVHGERTGSRWTYPLVGASLCLLLTVMDAQLSSWLLGQRPTTSWMLASVAWNSLGCLPLVLLRKG